MRAAAGRSSSRARVRCELRGSSDARQQCDCARAHRGGVWAAGGRFDFREQGLQRTLHAGHRQDIAVVQPIERRNMNVWEDEAARAAVAATGRRRLLVAGMLTEACVSFAVLSALAEGYEVFVVADACGGLTAASHDFALRRTEAAGARITSWIEVLLELQRDWSRKETYDGARSIVEANGGGYGIDLAYARDMIKQSV